VPEHLEKRNRINGRADLRGAAAGLRRIGALWGHAVRRKSASGPAEAKVERWFSPILKDRSRPALHDLHPSAYSTSRPSEKPSGIARSTAAFARGEQRSAAATAKSGARRICVARVRFAGPAMAIGSQWFLPAPHCLPVLGPGCWALMQRSSVSNTQDPAIAGLCRDPGARQMGLAPGRGSGIEFPAAASSPRGRLA